jgi:hypothetical protein
MSINVETKSRLLPTLVPSTATSTLETRSADGTWTSSSTTYNFGWNGIETTRSRDNWLWTARKDLERRAASRGRRLHKNTTKALDSQDMGNGEFENVKRWVEGSPRAVSATNFTSSVRRAYSGPAYAVAGSVGPSDNRFPIVPTDLRDRMIALGTTAIARTIPTSPHANASQFLGELRERLPAVPGRQLVRSGVTPGSISDEFLNIEFGIKPILSDLRKFGEAHRQSSRIIDQLLRDSGRNVRRRFAFPEERTVSEPVVIGAAGSQVGYPALATGPFGLYSSTGTLTRTRTQVSRFWFSGAYTYHYQRGDRALERMEALEQRMNSLYGLRVSPSTLWELAPWSWLVDWKTNFGDVVSNISAFSRDGLVLRYGYVMADITIADEYLLTGVTHRGGSSGPLSQTFFTRVKKRVKATPYGFGLDPGAFTQRQWAILTALGISKISGRL